MRTSGAATESNMIVVMGIIVLGVLTVLAGGPVDLMLLLERLLQSIAESAYQAWVAFGR